jgi:hypothetical protein
MKRLLSSGGTVVLFSRNFSPTPKQRDPFPSHANVFLGIGAQILNSGLYVFAAAFVLEDGVEYRYRMSDPIDAAAVGNLIVAADNFYLPGIPLFGIGEWYNLYGRQMTIAKYSIPDWNIYILTH